MSKNICRAAVALCLAALAPHAARAEAQTIRFAQQQSLGYLQFDVIKHEHLLEKRAAELGVPNLSITWATFSGPDTMNDALLSGAVDVVAGGVPGLLVIWGRTFGTRQEIRGISALTEGSSRLTTNNPALHSISDITPTSRIALPAIKVSIQAVLLEMAAAKAFGDDHFDKLNTQTMTLSPSDATIGLLSGSGGFDCAFTPMPFPSLQLKNPKIHLLIDSYDIMGPSTSSVAWTSKRFHDANPKLYQALLDSLVTASSFINAHRREALQYYLEDAHSNWSVDDLEKITNEPHAGFGVTPRGIDKFAKFMTKIGMLKVAPASDKDVFFPEIESVAQKD